MHNEYSREKYLTYVAIGDEKKIKIKISKTKQKNN